MNTSYIKEWIESQLKFNDNVNIFYEGENSMQFSREITTFLLDRRNELIIYLDTNNTEIIASYIAEQVMMTFRRANQFVDFDTKEEKRHIQIYKDMMHDIKDTTMDIQDIEYRHFHRLKKFMKETNAFLLLYTNAEDRLVHPVVCEEYSSQFQLEHLHIKQLQEPILDIGCGEHAELVHALHLQNRKAYGIDVLCQSSPFTQRKNWLRCAYGEQCWGTLISNMSFTLHFLNHHLREDGNFECYAKTYMEILQSLKVHGCWHYAPSIPFIEELLDSNEYKVEHYQHIYKMASTVITRLK